MESMDVGQGQYLEKFVKGAKMFHMMAILIYF